MSHIFTHLTVTDSRLSALVTDGVVQSERWNVSHENVLNIQSEDDMIDLIDDKGQEFIRYILNLLIHNATAENISQSQI